MIERPPQDYLSPWSVEGRDRIIIGGDMKMPTYELEDGTMVIHDAVWGDCEIGDRQPYDSLLMILARHPLFRRLQAVEQLTLPPEFSTVPNTSYFSRWQHIWGSLAFVRKMTEGDERFDDRQRTVLELRTLFSDVGQTAFSHLGDWIFQGIQGGEDLHDQDLRTLLETFQIDKLLAEYDLTLDETVFPETKDWVECPSPGLCVDRVDYGMREIIRWSGNPVNMAMLYEQQLTDPQSLFRINEQFMLEVTDEDFARRLAAGYSLLPTEHWAQPVHRLQLELLQVAAKRALLEGHFSDGVLFDGAVHPRDRMYGIDQDWRFAFASGIGSLLSRVMRSIGSDQREIYEKARQQDLNFLFSNSTESVVFPDFPDPLQSYHNKSELFGLVSPQVEMTRDETAQQGVIRTMGRIAFGLPALKPRLVDPPIYIDGQSIRLSQLDPRFANYLSGQTETMRHGYQAELLVNSEFSQKLDEIYQRVATNWPAAAAKDRNPRNLHRIVDQAGLYGGGRRFDDIREY